MPIEPNTGTALMIALLLALEVAGIGAWGLVFRRGRR